MAGTEESCENNASTSNIDKAITFLADQGNKIINDIFKKLI